MENPKLIENVATVVRNVDTLGVSKIYVIDKYNIIPKDREKIIKNTKLTGISCTANKYVYIRRFETTKECIEYLEKNKYKSMVTSPHIKTNKEDYNINLNDGEYTQKKLAVWFGNESHGITEEAINGSIKNIRIETCGIIESLNLATSTGIVLYTIMRQRQEFCKKIEK